MTKRAKRDLREAPACGTLRPALTPNLVACLTIHRVSDTGTVLFILAADRDNARYWNIQPASGLARYPIREIV